MIQGEFFYRDYLREGENHAFYSTFILFSTYILTDTIIEYGIIFTDIAG